MKWKPFFFQLVLLSATIVVTASCQQEQAVTDKTAIRDHAVHSDKTVLNDKGDTLYISNIDVNKSLSLMLKQKRS